ncbi:MAG: hypothetical protein ABI867_25890 [Kofleriaceae bacterium]
MVRRHVLAAIARGVAADEAGDDVARKALARIDFVLRGRARRTLEHALIDATIAANVQDDSPAAIRHRLRAAALVVQGRSDIPLADRDAVTRAYEQTDEVAVPRLPIASMIVGVATIAVSTAVAAAAVMVVTSPPPPGSLTRPTPPPAVAAYRDGGAPTRDPAIEAVLRTELPRVVAQHGGPRDPVALAPARGVATAWRSLVEYLEHGAPDLTSDLRVHAQILSDQFAAAGLGYFVDLEMTARYEPMLQAYRVEKITFVRAGDDRVRVLDVRRLVPGDSNRSILGMKPEGLADPVVMLDQIDEHVRTQLVPVLGGASYGIGDDWWARTPAARSASAAAGRAVRRELVLALGGETDPDKIEAKLRKLLLASTRHHEAQHGIEQEQHIPAHPEALALHVGPVRDASGRTNTQAVRARNELSAYTSQIASDMWLPQVVLWNLSRHAFQASRRGSVESFAAVLIIEGLARQLAIPSPGPVIHGGELDRERLARLVVPLAARPTIELRSAAARLWAELFGEPLVRLVDDVFGE